jgi:hypothetical protein
MGNVVWREKLEEAVSAADAASSGLVSCNNNEMTGGIVGRVSCLRIVVPFMQHPQPW